jgi:DUF1707 SHOCT-like domain
VLVMAGPGDGLAAGAAGRGRLRASHADREQVVGTLKAAFVQGRLTKDELDARVDLALGCRTCAGLAALTADLPPGLTQAEPLQPDWARDGRPVLPPGRVAAVATGLYAGVAGYELLLSPSGGDNLWAPPVIFGGFVVYLGILIICLAAIAATRREKRSSSQPPRRADSGDPASHCLP